jgi:hypothetical protein
MVEKTGGVVLWANRIGIFPKYGSGWYGVHIARQDYTGVNSNNYIPFMKKAYLNLKNKFLFITRNI